MKVFITILATCAFMLPVGLFSADQTTELSPILPENTLPFTLQVDVADFSLPTGIQSFANAMWKGKWLFVTGRTNGLHTFSHVGNNFPPAFQNTKVYVIDPCTGKSWSRSLAEGGLTQEEVDTLSVTAAQFFQDEGTLYVVGGYGINTLTGEMGTKNTLTSIDIEKMMEWVIWGKPSAKSAILQTSHPSLQVTGGALFQATDHEPMLLILGQNFEGLYRGGSNGVYTHQIRPFWVVEDDDGLNIISQPALKTYPDYRRRDLNIAPIILDNAFAYVALGGVFTITGGVWTVPIIIFPDGTSGEALPSSPCAFKQGMNHYNCPVFGLYSNRSEEMFVVLPGGISLGFFSGGVFMTDEEVPFINQITTIKIDKDQHYTQYIMDNEYPFIASTGSNPGNQLLFGAEAVFIPREDIALYRNGVIQLDALPNTPTVIGYIVGGIMSTVPNTSAGTDTTSSPYIFAVTLTPR